MEKIKNERLQEAYIGQEIAKVLAIDYDENQLLVKEFSDKKRHWQMEALQDVK
jgi:hypothetical protein